MFRQKRKRFIVAELDMNDHITAHYDNKYRDSDHTQVEKVKILKNPVHRSEAAVKWAGSGERVMEIGSGNGAILLSIKEQYQECVGIELSGIRAQESQRLFVEDNVEILHGNFESMDLDFPGNHFDTIIMVAVIEHLIDPFSAVEKIYALLKPGGRVIIDTPNMAKWTRRLKLLFGVFPGTASIAEGFIQYDRKSPTTLLDEGHFHYFTYGSLKKLLLRYDFKRVEGHGYGKSILTRIYPKMFSECLVIGTK